MEPVEGALGLDGALALAPGDGRVVPLEVAHCPSIELAICQENIPMGTASQRGLLPLHRPAMTPALPTSLRVHRGGSRNPRAAQGHPCTSPPPPAGASTRPSCPRYSPTIRAVDLKLGSKGQRPLPSSRRTFPALSCASVKFSTLCRGADGGWREGEGRAVRLRGIPGQGWAPQERRGMLGKATRRGWGQRSDRPSSPS